MNEVEYLEVASFNTDKNPARIHDIFPNLKGLSMQYGIIHE